MNGNITISNRSDSMVHINIQDEASRITFIDIAVTYEAFAKALTGLGCVPISFDVKGLEHVGKTKVREERTAVYPASEYNKDVLEQWLVENLQESGWILDTYIGSKGSVESCPEGTRVNYNVYKYV